MITETDLGASRRMQGLALVVPVLLAILLMLPRLLSPQLGLFDDGVTLVTVRQMTSGGGELWELALGRFRPTYWLYWLILELLAEGNPLIYFIGNLALLSATSALISVLLLKAGMGPQVAALAGSLFVLSGPVLENYYTLSKAEPIQVLLLVGSLVLIVSARSRGTESPAIGKLALVAIVLLLAMGTKETTIVIIPISALWLLAVIVARRRPQSTGLRLPAAYLACGLFAAAAYVLIRSAVFGVPLYGAGYVQRYSLEFDALIPSMLRWLAWMMRFFPYLIPIVVFAPILWLHRRGEAWASILFACTVWMLGWLAIIIPWTVSAGYFLLPFSAGAAAFSAVTLEVGRASILERSGSLRATAAILYVTAVALIAIVIVNGISIARLQLAVDRANHETIEWLAAELPPGARLLVNIQTENEYLDEIGIHLRDLSDRGDVQVSGYQSPSDFDFSSADGVYVLVADVEDQMGFSVRHGVIESSLERWNRGLEAALPPGAGLEFRFEENHRLIDIALLRLACPFGESLLYCEGSRQIVEVLDFRYGWRVYAIE